MRIRKYTGAPRWTTIHVFVDSSEILFADDLQKIKPFEVEEDKGVVITGRSPRWFLMCLAFQYSYCPWVAVFSPRLRGHVVVYSDSKDYPVGKLLSAHPFEW